MPATPPSPFFTQTPPVVTTLSSRSVVMPGTPPSPFFPPSPPVVVVAAPSSRNSTTEPTDACAAAGTPLLSIATTSEPPRPLILWGVRAWISSANEWGVAAVLNRVAETHLPREGGAIGGGGGGGGGGGAGGSFLPWRPMQALFDAVYGDPARKISGLQARVTARVCEAVGATLAADEWSSARARGDGGGRRSAFRPEIAESSTQRYARELSKFVVWLLAVLHASGCVQLGERLAWISDALDAQLARFDGPTMTHALAQVVCAPRRDDSAAGSWWDVVTAAQALVNATGRDCVWPLEQLIVLLLLVAGQSASYQQARGQHVPCLLECYLLGRLAHLDERLVAPAGGDRRMGATVSWLQMPTLQASTSSLLWSMRVAALLEFEWLRGASMEPSEAQRRAFAPLSAHGCAFERLVQYSRRTTREVQAEAAGRKSGELSFTVVDGHGCYVEGGRVSELGGWVALRPPSAVP